jgi:hypothetical protein
MGSEFYQANGLLITGILQELSRLKVLIPN